MNVNEINEGKNVVIVQKDEYDKIVNLAYSNQEKINEKAFSIWQDKGVAVVKITMELRSNNGRDIIDSGDNYFYTHASLYDGNNRFSISSETKRRFSKMIEEYTHDIMVDRFGEILSDINQEKSKYKNLKEKLTLFTVIGWLLSFTMFITIIMFLII